MARELREREHRGVGKEGYVVHAGEVGDGGTAADVEEDELCGEFGFTHAKSVRRGEGGGASVDGAARVVAQRGLDSVARIGDDFLAAGDDHGHVDADGGVAEGYAVLGGAASHVRGVGATDHGLGRGAARVDAGAAEQFAFDVGN